MLMMDSVGAGDGAVYERYSGDATLSTPEILGPTHEVHLALLDPKIILTFLCSYTQNASGSVDGQLLFEIAQMESQGQDPLGHIHNLFLIFVIRAIVRFC